MLSSTPLLREPQSARRPDRLPAAWLLLSLLLGAVFLVLPLKALEASPWTGIWPDRSDRGAVIASVTPGSPAERAGLRPGDTLLTLDGRPTLPLAFVRDRDYLPTWNEDARFWEERQLLDRNVRTGKPLRVEVLRGPRVHSAVLVPERLHITAALRHTLPYQVVGLVFLAVALLVALRLWTTPARLNLLGSAAIFASLSCLAGYNSRDLAFDAALHHLLQVCNEVGVFLFAAATVHFALTFPRPHPLLRKRPHLPWALWTGMAGLAALHFLRLFPGPLLATNLALLIGAAGLVAGTLTGASTLQSPVHRRQLQGLLIGLACGALPIITLTLLPLLAGLPFVAEEYTAACGVLIPASLGVSLLRWRLSELPVLATRALASLISLALLLASWFALSAATGRGELAPFHRLLMTLAMVSAVMLYPVLKRRVYRVLNGLGSGAPVGIDQVLEHFLGRHADGVRVQDALETTLEQILHYPILRRHPWLDEHSLRLREVLAESVRPRLGEELVDAFAGEAAPPPEIEACVFLAVGEAAPVLALGPRWNPDGWNGADLEVLGSLTAIAAPLLQAQESRAQAEEQRRLQLEQDKVTLERRVEERTRELEGTNARLSQALLAREDFLAAMSHELRTPLATLLGAAEAISAGIDGPPTPAMRERLATMLRNGRHLRELIGDVLDFARGRAGRLPIQKLPFRLQDVCAEALELVHSSAHHGDIRIETSLPSRPLAALGDPLRTRQILTNLLANAAHHGGGAVRLELGQQEDQIVLRVLDRGPGIPPEKADKLFQAFERLGRDLHDGASGTGLGLALSHMLAGLMNGSLEYRPRPGGGACFELRLPWSAVVPDPELPMDTSSVGAPLPGNLMLVEDHEELRELLSDYLGAQGWEIDLHSRAQPALDACRARMPDVLLTDLGLPGMSGLELVRQVRDLPTAGGLRIIVLTGQVMPEDTRQCLEAGADTVLPKPFPLTRLDRILRELPART